MWALSSQVMRSGRFIWRMLYRCIFHIILVRTSYVTPLIILRLITLISCDEEKKLMLLFM